MRVPVSVFNTLHYDIVAGGHTFPAGKEIVVQMERSSVAFREVRTTSGLRINRHNNDRFGLEHGYKWNMVHDAHIAGAAYHSDGRYRRAIEALAGPIIKNLPGAGYTQRPTHGWNVRFFNSHRIKQMGKTPLGPQDIFYSHGIGDKDYWTGPKIADFRFAMVPGPAWEQRMRATGYKGEIFIVGYTKLDPLFNGDYKRQQRGKPYVVWAPTHGYNNKHKGRSSYPQCCDHIHEIPERFDKHLALHPTSKINLKQKNDVTLQELLDADVVIADAGSTIYEAWALGKPVVFPDWLCKADVLARFRPGNLEYEIYSRGIGYHAKDMRHLVKLLDVAIAKGMQPAAQEFMERIFPTDLRGKAGATAAKVLQSL